MKYISLVGTQVMAVLNPLLAIKEQFRVPDEIHLLGTSFSNEKIETALQFLENDPDFKGRISKHKISDSIETDDSGALPAHTAVGDIVSRTGDEDEIIFNIAGGMNFQISACIQVIYDKDPLFVYPDFNGIHSFKLKQLEIHGYNISPPPEPVDVLKLQGIKFDKKNSKPGNSSLLALVKRMKPDRGRVFTENICIHDVVFDLAWNQNNTLHFIKIVSLSKEMRKVDAIAVNRDAFGELYHRNIHVLTSDTCAEDRATKEGRGKVRIYKLDSLKERDLQGALIKVLGNIPGKKAPSVPAGEIFHGKPGKYNPASALVMMLGRNVLPTLIALWSHHPEHAIFLYTPDNLFVGKVKDLLVKNKRLLPVRTFEFKPLSFMGNDILMLNRPNEKHVSVNISPGTKAHTLFLTQWAFVHQAGVYSINDKALCLSQIPSGVGQKLIGPSPLTLLTLCAGNVENKKENKFQLLEQRNRYETIIEFVRMIMNDSEKFKDFPHNEVRSGQATAIPDKTDREKTRIDLQNGSAPIEIREGIWVEQLTGFMIADCGAQDVQTRIRTSWNEESKAYLKRKRARITHQTDIDVIARFDASYYVIECKTSKNPSESIGSIVNKVIAYAGVVGRFAVPMICLFRYTGEPYEDKGGNGVYIFGCQTLLDKEALNALLKKALQKRQKTRWQ